MNVNSGPKIMQYVVKNEWKRKTSAKCTLEIMQNVAQKQCKEQYKINENYTPMQNVIEK